MSILSKLRIFFSKKNVEIDPLHILDGYTDAELVEYFFRSRREMYISQGIDPDTMVGERKLIVGKHWLAREYEKNKKDSNNNNE